MPPHDTLVGGGRGWQSDTARQCRTSWQALVGDPRHNKNYRNNPSILVQHRPSPAASSASTTSDAAPGAGQESTVFMIDCGKVTAGWTRQGGSACAGEGFKSRSAPRPQPSPAAATSPPPPPPPPCRATTTTTTTRHHPRSQTFRESIIRWGGKLGVGVGLDRGEGRSEAIDAVLLTHEHADAMLGLDDLRGLTNPSANPFSSSAPADGPPPPPPVPMPIFLSDKTFAVVKRAFPYLIPAPPKPGAVKRWVAQLDFQLTDYFRPFAVGPTAFEITPIPMVHGEVGACGSGGVVVVWWACSGWWVRWWVEWNRIWGWGRSCTHPRAHPPTQSTRAVRPADEAPRAPHTAPHSPPTHPHARAGLHLLRVHLRDEAGGAGRLPVGPVAAARVDEGAAAGGGGAGHRPAGDRLPRQARAQHAPRHRAEPRDRGGAEAEADLHAGHELRHVPRPRRDEQGEREGVRGWGERRSLAGNGEVRVVSGLVVPPRPQPPSPQSGMPPQQLESLPEEVYGRVQLAHDGLVLDVDL